MMHMRSSISAAGNAEAPLLLSVITARRDANRTAWHERTRNVLAGWPGPCNACVSVRVPAHRPDESVSLENFIVSGHAVNDPCGAPWHMARHGTAWCGGCHAALYVKHLYMAAPMPDSGYSTGVAGGRMVTASKHCSTWPTSCLASYLAGVEVCQCGMGKEGGQGMPGPRRVGPCVMRYSAWAPTCTSTVCLWRMGARCVFSDPSGSHVYMSSRCTHVSVLHPFLPSTSQRPVQLNTVMTVANPAIAVIGAKAGKVGCVDGQQQTMKSCMAQAVDGGPPGRGGMCTTMQPGCGCTHVSMWLYKGTLIYRRCKGAVRAL